MVRHFLLILCCIGGCLSAAAQQTLNIHTTTQGIVSFTFAEKPQVSFPSAEVLAVKAGSVTLEFPYSEVQKITFEDGVDAVEKLTVRDASDVVLVYDLTGKLMLRGKAVEGTSTIDLSTLHSGVYVIKDGKRTYKVTKR